MSADSSAFEAHLAPEEALVSVESGTLVDDGSRSRASIGVTDRRLLLVSDHGFVDVAHDTIHAIRSRPQQRLTGQAFGSVLLVLAGALLAILAAVGVALVVTSTLAAALVMVTVAGAVGAEFLRRSEVRLDGSWIRRAAVRLEGTRAERLQQPPLRLAASVQRRALLPAGAALVAVGGFVGLIVHTSDSVLISLTLVAIGGLVVVDAVGRQLRHLGKSGERWRRERDVRVLLIDGRSVRFQIRAETTVDRDLSRLTCGRGYGQIDAEVVPG